jgi:hypothetical protein
VPVDIEQLTEAAPAQYQWIFAETQTFGADVEEFHNRRSRTRPTAA